MKPLTIIQEVTKDWLDFTSLKEYMRCPRAFWWRYIMHVTPSAPSAALINGAAFHDGNEAFHTAILAGAGWEDALKLGVKALVTTLSELETDEPKYALSNAVDTWVAYQTFYRGEPYQTIASEDVGAIDMGDFAFVFKIDRLAKGPFGLTVMETKTTTIVGTKWEERGKPNLQLDGYMVGASVLTGEDYLAGVLDVIPIHENPLKRQRPFRIHTTRSHEEMATWHQNICSWMETIRRSKEGGFFPMNTEACVPMLSFKCPYTLLCAAHPNIHEAREIPLPDAFKIEEWRPFDEIKKGGEKNAVPTN